MTGLNHAVTGALVAASINKPILALPAALLSHFAVDMIPHWNYKIKGDLQQLAMMMDLTLLLSVLLILSVTVDGSTRLIIAGGFLGILPDAMWLPELLKGKQPKIDGKSLWLRLRRLHSKIQWSETSNGIYVEIVWLMATLFLIYKL